MGKEEDKKEKVVSDKNDKIEDKTDINQQKTPPKQSEESKSTEEIKDVDSSRQIIKLGSPGGEKEQTAPEKKTADPQAERDISENLPTKGALELKREILQRIKDFDFQIKKNHEELENLNQRLDSVTKDLDDLVSLYEIVSEQMNPFVGLSSVTKKRIEALENYTTEIETVKKRLSELEAFAEKCGAKLGKTMVKREENHVLDTKLSEGEIDKIIEETFDQLSFYPEIDDVIDRFIENIKIGG